MKEHANTLVTHFGVDHPDLIHTIYKLVDLKSVFSIIQIGNKTKTLKNKWKYKILKNKLKQKQPPYSNILFSRYIYIYKKLRSDPHHFSTVCWHSYCNRLKTQLRFCINWKTGKELTHPRTHTHAHTCARAHSHASYMHSHTKETKERKTEKQTHVFPQRSICSILLEQQVATAGACLPVLAPCALRAAGCAAGLSAGLGPSHQCCPQPGDVPAPWTRVLVIFLLPLRMISTLTCCKGEAGGGGRQNPQHGALGASPPVGGFERGLGTARKSNLEGMVLA